MKRIGLLLVGLLCISVMIYAGEVITNDTGEDATGLRVAFSTPVLITTFGDILTSVDPQMLAFEFVFSGGVVEPWESQWFNYAPATARVMEVEWLASPVKTEADQVLESSETTLSVQKPDGLQYVNLFWWFDILTTYSIPRNEILEGLLEIEEAGWNGVSLDYFLFVDSLTTNDVFACHEDITDIGGSMRTPTDAELTEWLEIIEQETSLDVNLRITIVLTKRAEEEHDEFVWRGMLRPKSVSTFFDDLFEILYPIAQLCNTHAVDIFTPLVEMSSIEQYDSEIHRLLDRLDPHFDGWFAIDQATHHYIQGFNTYSSERSFDKNAGTFWNWIDEDSRPLIIQVNAIDLTLSRTSNPSRDAMVAEFKDMWRDPVNYYRTSFPGHPLMLGEVFTSQHDGASMGWRPNEASFPLDYGEMGDILHAVIVGAQQLGIDGFSVGYYNLYGYEDWYTIIPNAVKPSFEPLLE